MMKIFLHHIPSMNNIKLNQRLNPMVNLTPLLCPKHKGHRGQVWISSQVCATEDNVGME